MPGKRWWLVGGVAWMLAVPAALRAALTWLPGPSVELWLLATFAAEHAALLLLGALTALALAVTLRVRTGGKGVVVGVLAAVTAVATVVPVAAAHRVAAREDVALRWSDQFAGTALTAERRPDRTEVYATVAGQRLHADLWLPPTAAPAARGGRPAVVWVHGGSWEEGRRSETPEWDSELSAAGAVVIDVEYRLSPQGRWRDQPADVACALGWVGANAARLGIDPTRVVLKGVSAGAHLSLLAAYAPQTFRPSCGVAPLRPAAVVALYPPTDMTALHDLDDWRQPDLFGLGGLHTFMQGTPTTDPDNYRLASPLTHVRAGVPPTLVVHGDHDQIVPVDQGRALVDRLDAVGVPHRYVELPFANHGFDFAWGGPNTQVARAAVARFIAEHT
ncbi:alpha/beta hydrolase [Micromonospora siamensis]|uniref:Acetyl esterase/lipase n=1 Tax=Micromonospora siamensis TaxID=299152 RepID=A0A1C5JMG5_9ACTN|nr:alpha/beta hydrolase [Micromonospora siamensis]SCG71760.1 Acetyl esterase/lipase [Micromonospora siamensis]